MLLSQRVEKVLLKSEPMVGATLSQKILIFPLLSPINDSAESRPNKICRIFQEQVLFYIFLFIQKEN